jgi:hypothetical protein
MSDGLKLMNEYQAVKMLVERTGTAFVFKGPDVCGVGEILNILQKGFDHERRYILDNGPEGNEPGVYTVGSGDEINPSRLYAPVNSVSSLETFGKVYSGQPTMSPSRTHVDFGDD